ncbi:MAG: LuxR C-terminal-related transcriptional regulator [Steroidobacteraceae bacterium]
MSTPLDIAGRTQRTVRVMIVSEVRLYREGLMHALASQQGVEVVGGAAGDVRICAPQLVLADSAIVRTTELAARAADLGVPVVAFAVDEHDEEEVLACAEAGVAGFVARDATMEELLKAVQTAAHGDLPCSPRVARLLVRCVAARGLLRQRTHANARLTRREAEIVRLIDDGLSNKEIARRLSIETATVKNHVHHLLEKLQVHRRGEAAAIVRAVAPSERAKHLVSEGSDAAQ